MSEETPVDSVPCPSCGGAVSTAPTDDELVWTVCPHCEHEWACRLSRSGPGRERRTDRRAEWPVPPWQLPTGLVLYAAGLLILRHVVVRMSGSWAYEWDRASLAAGGCLAACFFAPGWWRWAGFLVTLVLTVGGDAIVFFVGYTGMVCGLSFREWGAARRST